ncbi:metal ABC transporter solute-binding protein, Zn/Mn family [Roseicitreum antarcticum]|uniref:Manganese/zinc/iron transport system substrate-binding protein n=1 Tax=Roseicitreum antarcticum TaxID=564137 RepID=A0A1H3BUS8_9RHOB|nr:zinc ABC transporter substrate-binding protein [Roseicitreum antarcticum]SDX45780.1 manganese/zinc/iron transport system substrate-binding protein [Roseicitreum antarcticum]
MRQTLTLVPLMAALSVAAPARAADTAPLQVLATVGMVADLAQRVGGGCAEVEAMMGAGSDPHLYQPTASDVSKLQAAELILYVHPTLEARLATVLERFSQRTPTLGLVAATYGPDDLRAASGGIDPHIWMDVALWSRIVPVIAEAIAEARPDCRAMLDAQAAALGAELDALHGWVTASIGSIPDGARQLVTAHDAFGYFATAYGMDASEGIEGISTESEASIGDIREVAQFVAEIRLPAVFVETTINPRTVEAMVAESRALGHEVAIGGALYSDAMGAPGMASGTYIGMIRANTVAITTALGGTPPPLPGALAGWAASFADELAGQ